MSFTFNSMFCVLKVNTGSRVARPGKIDERLRAPPSLRGNSINGGDPIGRNPRRERDGRRVRLQHCILYGWRLSGLFSDNVLSPQQNKPVGRREKKDKIGECRSSSMN